MKDFKFMPSFKISLHDDTLGKRKFFLSKDIDIWDEIDVEHPYINYEKLSRYI